MAIKINQYGFLPKVGQWIRATGRPSPPKDDLYDPSISNLLQLEHIDPPRQEKNIIPHRDNHKSMLKIEEDIIIENLSHQWQNIEHLTFKLGIEDDADINNIKSKLVEMTVEGKIGNLTHQGRDFWKLKSNYR